MLAEKIYGSVNAVNRKRIRNALYYMERENKGVRKRADGMWEVAPT